MEMQAERNPLGGWGSEVRVTSNADPADVPVL